MALVHYLYIGYFDRENETIRFGPAGPVLRNVLPCDDVTKALDVVASGIRKDNIPAEWGVSICDGYVLCDWYGANSDGLKFVALLAKTNACDIFDMGQLVFVSPDDVMKALIPSGSCRAPAKQAEIGGGGLQK